MEEKRKTGKPNRDSRPALKRAQTSWWSPSMAKNDATRTQRIAKRSGARERERELEVDAVSTKANKAYHESRIAQNEGDNERKK